MDKLIKKITSLAVLGATVFAVSVPTFAANATIDLAKMEVGPVAYGQAYSFDAENWTPIFGTKLDISKAVENGDTDIYILHDLGSLYALKEGETLSSTTDYYKLTFPAKEDKPLATNVKFTTAATGTEKNNVSAGATHEFKIGNIAWTTAPASNGILVGNVEAYGGTMLVRTKANTKLASEPLEVEIPKIAEAPAAKYDETFDAITEVDDTMEYYIATVASAAPTWLPVPSTKFTIPRASLTETAKSFVFVRVKGSASAAASAIKAIPYPLKSTKTVSPKMDIVKEKITSVSNLMEYRTLTAAQLTAFAADANKDAYSNPEWTGVSGTEIDLADIISANATNAAAVRAIQVRAKPIAAVTKPVPALAVPASAITTFKITERPAKPSAPTFVYTSAPEKLTLGSGATPKLEFKTSTGASWVSTGFTPGTAFNIDSSGSTVLKIPAAGKDALTFGLRVQAGFTGTGDATEYTPASEILEDIEIVVRPDTPAPEFDKVSNRLSGIDTSMQFTVGADTTWADCTTSNLIGKALNASGSTYAGTTTVFNFRVKAVTGAPVSAIKSISCVIAPVTP